MNMLSYGVAMGKKSSIMRIKISSTTTWYKTGGFNVCILTLWTCSFNILNRFTSAFRSIPMHKKHLRQQHACMNSLLAKPTLRLSAKEAWWPFLQKVSLP